MHQGSCICAAFGPTRQQVCVSVLHSANVMTAESHRGNIIPPPYISRHLGLRAEQSLQCHGIVDRCHRFVGHYWSAGCDDRYHQRVAVSGRGTVFSVCVTALDDCIAMFHRSSLIAPLPAAPTTSTGAMIKPPHLQASAPPRQIPLAPGAFRGLRVGLAIIRLPEMLFARDVVQSQMSCCHGPMHCTALEGTPGLQP